MTGRRMTAWKSKVTDDARRRMARTSARDQRREALEQALRDRARTDPVPGHDDDADDASLRRGVLM